MHTWLLAVAWLVAGLFGLAYAGSARADQVTCSSNNYSYQYCRADTGNYVRISHQNSKSACVYGSSWGYDGRGVWVDNGCGATFEYGYGSNHNSGHHKDNSDSVVAGVAALAIIGAIAASSNHHKHDDSGESARVPGWAVGTYSGGDRIAGAPISLSISGNGRITGYYGHRSLDGQFDGDRAYLGGRGYSAYSTRSGFQLVADDDRRMVIDLYRD